MTVLAEIIASVLLQGSMTEGQFLAMLAALIAGVLIVLFGGGRIGTRFGARYRKGLNPTWERVDVSLVTLALDSRCRPFVEAALETGMVKTSGDGELEERARQLRELALVLRRVEPAWQYAGIIDSEPDSTDRARETFQKCADDARSRYAALPVEEGPGSVLVTIVVAARTELIDVHTVDLEGVKAALAGFVALAPLDVSALDIQFSPGAPARSHPRSALESMPELAEISTTKDVLYCERCGGLRDLAVASCPYC